MQGDDWKEVIVALANRRSDENGSIDAEENVITTEERPSNSAVMTFSFLLLIVVVGVLAIIGTLLRNISDSSRATKSSKSYSYSKKPYLFTRAERSFLGVLEQASDERYRVFGKVRLADILEPQSGMARGGRQGAFNKISSKHLDFLLCAPEDLSPVAAVELDDRSHQLPQRRARDTFLEGALRTAGLPLLRFPVQSSYSVHEVRASLATLLHSTPDLVNGSQDSAVTPESQVTQCSKCGGTLVDRVGRKGANAGSRFLGCKNYPKCRNVVALPEAPVGS